MAKNQIVLLVVVIIVYVYLLSLLVKYEIKKKPKNSTSKKLNQPQEKPQSQSEKSVEDTTQPKELVVEKQDKQDKQKSSKSPDISVALLDELHEFQNYLKQRVTPDTKSTDDVLHPYDTPRFSALDDSFSRRKNDFAYSNYDDFDDDFDDFPIKENSKTSRQNTLENLPNEIKILMMTDFFDTKF